MTRMISNLVPPALAGLVPGERPVDNAPLGNTLEMEQDKVELLEPYLQRLVVHGEGVELQQPMIFRNHPPG
jgi:hypothetical protein